MPGINPLVMVHHLNVELECRAIKQMKCSFAPKCQRVKDKKLDKLLDVGFITVTTYPILISNVVMVKKKNSKWPICIDFTNLNWACLKDDYPLPRIDQMVDTTLGHDLLNFIDAFFSYNQIGWPLKIKKKLPFITEWGHFYYMVMLFGHKNIGATYQCLVNSLQRLDQAKYRDIHG